MYRYNHCSNDRKTKNGKFFNFLTFLRTLFLLLDLILTTYFPNILSTLFRSTGPRDPPKWEPKLNKGNGDG